MMKSHVSQGFHCGLVSITVSSYDMIVDMVVANNLHHMAILKSLKVIHVLWVYRKH